MATDDEAADAIVNRIMELAPVAPTSEKLLLLAEALAWVRDPSQSHG